MESIIVEVVDKGIEVLRNEIVKRELIVEIVNEVIYEVFKKEIEKISLDIIDNRIEIVDKETEKLTVEICEAPEADIVIGYLKTVAGNEFDEIRLIPKISSNGLKGTVFFCSEDDHLWVATS